MSCGRSQPAPVRPAAPGLEEDALGHGGVCVGGGRGWDGAGLSAPTGAREAVLRPFPTPRVPSVTLRCSGRCSGPGARRYLRCFLRSRAGACARSAGGETEAGMGGRALGTPLQSGAQPGAPSRPPPSPALPPPSAGGLAGSAACVLPAGRGSWRGRGNKRGNGLRPQCAAPAPRAPCRGAPHGAAGTRGPGPVLGGGGARSGELRLLAQAGPAPSPARAGGRIRPAGPVGKGLEPSHYRRCPRRAGGAPLPQFPLDPPNGGCGNGAQGQALRPDWLLASGMLEPANEKGGLAGGGEKRVCKPRLPGRGPAHRTAHPRGSVPPGEAQPGVHGPRRSGRGRAPLCYCRVSSRGGGPTRVTRGRGCARARGCEGGVSPNTRVRAAGPWRGRKGGRMGAGG